MDRAFPPSPRRLQRAHVAGLVPRARWLTLLSALVGAAAGLAVVAPVVWRAAAVSLQHQRPINWSHIMLLFIAVPTAAAVAASLAHAISIGRIVAPRRHITGAPVVADTMSRRAIRLGLGVIWLGAVAVALGSTLRDLAAPLIVAASQPAQFGAIAWRSLATIIGILLLGAAIDRLLVGHWLRADLRMTDAERRADARDK